MQPANTANLFDGILSVNKARTKRLTPGQTKHGHYSRVCASTTRGLANWPETVSSPASFTPFRSRETVNPVDSKQFVGRSQQRTSPCFRRKFQQIFPRGHWVRSERLTSGYCKSHKAKQPTPHCRQRHPHQIVWHPPNRTSTGATKVYLAFHRRRSHTTHNGGRFPPITQPPGRSRQRTTHSHRQSEDDQRCPVVTRVISHHFTCSIRQVHVPPA